MKSKYVVRWSMGVGKRGRNANTWHIALMEMEPDADHPAMISVRAKGCIRVVERFEYLYIGARGVGRDIVNRLVRRAEEHNAEHNAQ